jgi:Gas vesicle synthesis protein GvpO
VTQTDRTKSTRSKGTDTDSSHSLFSDLLRRATSPEVLAGVAGAAAAAHFTRHSVDKSDGDEPDASADPAENTASDEAEDEAEDGPESESAEVAEDEQPEEPEEPEDEEAEEPEAEADEEPEDEEAEEPEAEADEEPEDEEAEEPEDEPDQEDKSAESHNGSLGDDDERMQLLARARQYAEEFTGHPVESFSGLAKDEHGWRIGMEVVEVARVPSTTDVLASYEVVLSDDGDLVDFCRSGRYCRNATDGNSG